MLLVHCGVALPWQPSQVHLQSRSVRQQRLLWQVLWLQLGAGRLARQLNGVSKRSGTSSLLPREQVLKELVVVMVVMAVVQEVLIYAGFLDYLDFTKIPGRCYRWPRS